MKISCALSVWFSEAIPGQSYQPCRQKQSLSYLVIHEITLVFLKDFIPEGPLPFSPLSSPLTRSDYFPVFFVAGTPCSLNIPVSSVTFGNSLETHCPFTKMLIRNLSHPALLLTAVMPFTPVFNRPLIKFSGIPHKPKPGTEQGEIKHTQ